MRLRLPAPILLAALAVALHASSTTEPPISTTTSSGNSSEEEPIELPTFTYEGADADIKEAAYRKGLDIRGEKENQLELPELDMDAQLEEDRKRNWQTYRWNPYAAQQRRMELLRQHAARLGAARAAHEKRMTGVCYTRCNAYINETFERPDLSESSNGSALLQQLEMDEFPAKYLTMGLEAMQAITKENCEQWEADYQCIFGCSADAELVDRLKRGLAGDFHLTANVECPNPDFSKFLPCVGEKVEEWLGPCQDRLKGYQRVKAEVNSRILVLEKASQQLVANYTAQRQKGAYIYGDLSAYIIPYVLQIQAEQSKICGAYGDLLMCSLGLLKTTCSERATSFVHTSLAENFASKVVLGKELVKAHLGGLSSVCMQLANKATFRVFPIKK